jgi:putative transposase
MKGRDFRDEEDEAHRREDHRRGEADGSRAESVKEVAREMGVTDQTLYNWKSKYGGMEVSDAKRLKALEDENRRLKNMVADLSLDKEALTTVIRKNGWSL